MRRPVSEVTVCFFTHPKTKVLDTPPLQCFSLACLVAGRVSFVRLFTNLWPSLHPSFPLSGNREPHSDDAGKTRERGTPAPSREWQSRNSHRQLFIGVYVNLHHYRRRRQQHHFLNQSRGEGG